MARRKTVTFTNEVVMAWLDAESRRTGQSWAAILCGLVGAEALRRHPATATVARTEADPDFVNDQRRDQATEEDGQ